jgi:hypothetical protein
MIRANQSVVGARMCAEHQPQRAEKAEMLRLDLRPQQRSVSSHYENCHYETNDLLSFLSLMALLAGAILGGAQQFHFTTLAGSARGPGHSDGPRSAGTVDRDSADGTGSDARFSGPVGVAVDSTGNIYVADQVNHTIRLGKPVPITQPALRRNSLLRLPNGQFQVEVTASTNQLVLIQATSVLSAADWITLQTGTLSTGQMTFTDPHPSSFTVRFYRAVSPVP